MVSVHHLAPSEPPVDELHHILRSKLREVGRPEQLEPNLLTIRAEEQNVTDGFSSLRAQGTIAIVLHMVTL
jgi:hypothetical protein